MKKIYVFLNLVLGFCIAGNGLSQEKTTPALVDENANAETKALFVNLQKIAKSKMLIGHQDALAYGIGWKEASFRNDGHDVCGKFPAVYGWDLAKIGTEKNIDDVKFENIRNWIIAAFEKGGINTISWHEDNPATSGNAWDVSPAVKDILPGGTKHVFFKERLDLIADFFLSLKSKDGKLVPIIFRPYHENDGGWFWWGAASCTTEEYIALWKFTIEYLRNTKKVHNLLYAYSWGKASTEDEYLTRYPGDDYVDILGLDIYGTFGQNNDADKANLQKLRTIVTLAEKKNKIAALTETGVEKIPDANYWTQQVLLPIKNDKIAKKIAFALFWRNGRPDHFYYPYPGHASVADFLKFEKDKFTLFLEDLPDVYNVRK